MPKNWNFKYSYVIIQMITAHFNDFRKDERLLT